MFFLILVTFQLLLEIVYNFLDFATFFYFIVDNLQNKPVTHGFDRRHGHRKRNEDGRVKVPVFGHLSQYSAIFEKKTIL